MAFEPGARLGPYELLSVLGTGGMGEVYRARDTRLSRVVAIKVLPDEFASDRSRLLRFENEARAASALNHPNIVTIYDVGRTDKTSYIAMELVDGVSLRQLLASVGGPLTLRKALGISAQVADGLAKAHGAGIVHRDLKPENLMVSSDGFVKILDFGLAKLVEPALEERSAVPTKTLHLESTPTRPGSVMGTVGYMSPEQAGGRPVDFRSDQFSFGSILYELLAGRRAFSEATDVDTLAAILHHEPPPLGDLRPEAPLPLQWILARCLAKDPEERYASTRDLSRDLADVRNHLSGSGARAGMISPADRRGRRRSAFFAAAAFSAVGVLLGVIGLSLLAGRKAAGAPSFHRLTFRQGLVANARFTPDGRTIVYGAFWEGDQTRLYQTRMESPESRAYEFPDADILSISPRAEMAILLFDRSTFRATLARVPLAGGTPRPVFEGISYSGADWSPDGDQFAIVRSAGGGQRLEYPIGTVLYEAASIFGPRFSSRGHAIAFFEFGKTGSVSVFDIEARRKTTLSSGWARVSGVPCWMPDQREIWFTAAEAGEPEALWAVRESGKRRLVSRLPGRLELDDVYRDGRVLLAHHTMLRIVRGVVPGEPKERDLAWLDYTVPADLSSDGKTMLFYERGEGSGHAPTIYLRKTDGSPPVRLGEGVAIALSPNQKWALGIVERGGRGPALVLLPVGAGETKALAHARFETLGWGGFTPDGSRIVYSATEGGRRSRIYLQDVSGGGARPITAEGVRIPAATNPVSPDGKSVFGVEGPEKAAIYSLEGGEPRPIHGLARQDSLLRWSADGRSLFVLRADTLPKKILLLDIETGSSRLWEEIPRAAVAPVAGSVELLLTPDGRWSVYGETGAVSALYVVEGLR